MNIRRNDQRFWEIKQPRLEEIITCKIITQQKIIKKQSQSYCKKERLIIELITNPFFGENSRRNI